MTTLGASGLVKVNAPSSATALLVIVTPPLLSLSLSPFFFGALALSYTPFLRFPWGTFEKFLSSCERNTEAFITTV